VARDGQLAQDDTEWRPVLNAGDAVERLAALAGLGVGDAAAYDWAAVERSLEGLQLLSDYKRLVDTFPDGKFKEPDQGRSPGERRRLPRVLRKPARGHAGVPDRG
jgi:hypothetical protein